MNRMLRRRSRDGWLRSLIMVAALTLTATVPAASVHASVPGPTAASPDNVFTSEDTAVTFNPLDNDSATLIASTVSVTAPNHGTAVTNTTTGTITYTPAAHYNGPDSFSYSACDSANVCPSATVSVDVRLLGPYRMLIALNQNSNGQFTYDSMWPDAGGESTLPGAAGGTVADWALISPDGRKLATVVGGTLKVTFLDGSLTDQVATLPGPINYPSWSPDSNALAFEAPAKNPDPNLPGYVGAIYTMPLASQPNQQPDAEPLSYQVGDGHGGVKTVYVEGNAPSWERDSLTITFDSFSDEDPSDCADVGGPPCGKPGLWTALAGNEPIQLLAPAAAGADDLLRPNWAPDGTLAFWARTHVPNTGSVRYALNIDDFSGPVPTEIKAYVTSDQSLDHDRPSWSPDSTKIAYNCCQGAYNVGDVYVINRDGTNETRVTFHQGTRPSWSPTPATTARPWEHGGKLLYITGPPNGEYGQNSKVTRLNPDGSGWTTFLTDSAGCPSSCRDRDARWSPDGSHIAFSTERGQDPSTAIPEIGLINADGTGFRSLTNTYTCEPAWSPDGSKIAYVQHDQATGYEQLWTMNADGSGKSQLTSSAAYDSFPAWSPDGKWIAFSRSDNYSCLIGASFPRLGTLMVVPAAGGAAVSFAGGISGVQPSWSPDGTKIAFASNHFTPDWQICIASFVADPTPTITSISALTPANGEPSAQESGPTWSPDGQAIAYTKGDIIGSQYVMVINADGTRPTRITGTSDSAYTPDWGVVPGPPTISSFSPTSGPVGTSVAITGTNLGTTTAVAFNGTAASFHVDSVRRVTASVPAGATTGKITVTTALGAAESAEDFAVTAAGPTISGLTPAGGPTTGGTSVTITGTGFQVGSTVTFGGVGGTVTGGSGSTQLSVTTPAHDAGQVDVVVTNPDGQSATAQNGFTYVAGPSISNVSPSSGPTAGGTGVTITGSNFGGPGTTATFGGVAATVTGGSATTLNVTTPAHAAGQVDVVVTNPDGESATAQNGFTYVSAPSIDRVEPNAGPPGGGTAVTIYGSNFGGPGTKVTFGDVSATVNGGSSTTLQVVTPPHAAGTVDVVVTNPDGQTALKPNAFTYASLYVAVVPSIGPAGTSVQLAGAGFRAGETVNVSYTTGLKHPSSVTLCSSTARIDGTWSCTATIPTTNPGAPGAHTITAVGKKSKATAATSFTLTT